MIELLSKCWREAATRTEVCCMGCLLHPTLDELDRGSGCPGCGHDRFVTFDFRTIRADELANSATIEASAEEVLARWESIDGRRHRRIRGNRWQFGRRKSVWIGALGVSSRALLATAASGGWVWGDPDRRVARPLESIRRASTRRALVTALANA